jgi:hypothetical protein
MGMEYVRKTYGVPAKRGAAVRPKVGPAKHCLGVIRRADSNGRLVVTDTLGRHHGWWGIFHPDDLEYLPANTHYPPHPTNNAEEGLSE